jgi:cellobiose phosphorylase
MSSPKSFYEFLPDGVTFRSTEAMGSRLIYVPLCGADETGIKSAITPYLSGDIKIDKARYLTRPASREDLRKPVRNFFIRLESKHLVLSMDDQSLPDDGSFVESGQLWHKVVRPFPATGITVEALTFVPVSGEKVELTRVTVKNTSIMPQTVTPTAVVPIFGRALANKHDHEHVTALLHRTSQLAAGVLVEPTMLFNEEGHQLSASTYYVFGCEGDGKLPIGTFPTAESFFGEAGNYHEPVAIYQKRSPGILSEAERDGKEAVGALRFETITLKPGEQKDYLIIVGLAEGRDEALRDFTKFSTNTDFNQALAENKTFWDAKTSAVLFESSDKAFSAWMRWVALQPIFRRIFGCSFLPDHDYGKGGKGWRDIWQDLLSLILIEPNQVRQSLLNNFAGVRIDGSNATIIGADPGEFIADRNSIARVWMDHGAWPFLTTLLYIDQSGDTDILFEETTYFRDRLMTRSFEKYADWKAAYGNQLKDKHGNVYRGTVLEHVLVQNLVQFFNVGEHNITRLESADWNDGLDMAFKRGESVAFMSFYAGNLLQIASLIEAVARRKGRQTVRLAKELLWLLDTIAKPISYDDLNAKKARLFEDYFRHVQPELSGETVEVEVAALVNDLRKKGEWAFAHIRAQEKVSVDRNGETLTWFNGYYDNDGVRVEGEKNGQVRMTLTGQVFPVMTGLAQGEEIREVVKVVRAFLKDKSLGGYRLNTDFGLRHYQSLGRGFGFAYGTKENGAVFSHMCVMYAYGLYKQGFAREGHEVLRSLYEMSAHPERARIYPGVPEYFDSLGRGMYHFLTGSASWYVLTMLTQAYGVRGDLGDLVLAPQLLAEEFNEQGEARVVFSFAGKSLTVVYVNPKRVEAGVYRIERVETADRSLAVEQVSAAVVRLERAMVSSLLSSAEIRVLLGCS